METAEITYDELKKKTVDQLRDIARDLDNDELKGFRTMHKEPLLNALCKILGIEGHVHHEVVGVDKRSIKLQIRELKGERDAALEAHDHKQLRIVRRKIHRLKRKIQKATA